jgi:hypothetical protein
MWDFVVCVCVCIREQERDLWDFVMCGNDINFIYFNVSLFLKNKRH